MSSFARGGRRRSVGNLGEMVRSERRIPELDGLRGVAVIMVLAWHFIGSPSGGTEYAKPLHYMTVFGRTGVDLFFVLSGFLITGILADFRSSRHMLPTFYARRALRIYPAYVVLIGLYWAVFLILGPTRVANADVVPVWQQVLAQVTFTWNWLMAAHNGPVAQGFSITWSVAIEEWFYLLLPAIVILTPPRKLVVTLLAIGSFSVVARAWTYILFPEFTLAPYVLTPLRLDGLCFGGIVALVYRDAHLMAELRKRDEDLMRLALRLCLVIPILIALIRGRPLNAHMYTWGHLYLAIAFSILLLAILVRQNVPRLRSEGLQLAGRYSYSLYLFHPLFIALAFELAGRKRRFDAWLDVGLAAGAFVVTIIFCVALYRILERPMIAFGRERMSYAHGWRRESSGVAEAKQ